jgi:hypothetical protein
MSEGTTAAEQTATAEIEAVAEEAFRLRQFFSAGKRKPSVLGLQSACDMAR